MPAVKVGWKTARAVPRKRWACPRCGQPVGFNGRNIVHVSRWAADHCRNLNFLVLHRAGARGES